MRLKADIWCKAYVRTCASHGAAAYVVAHGDDDAGAIFIKISRLDGTARVYGPAPMGFSVEPQERRWAPHLDGADAPDADVEDYLSRQRDYDPDIWIIEVEDREGRHFLDDWLLRDGHAD